MMRTGTGIRSNKTGNKAHAHAERGNDLYETPEVGTLSLLRYEDLPINIWEPACGRSLNIVRPLRESGRSVIATDLIDYEWDYSMTGARGGMDFLTQTRCPPDTEAIITNPPFKDAEKFVAHARKLCPLVIMLLRLAFLESVKRCPILDQGDLARVYVYRKRLPMMHRDGWEGRKANSGMAFCWMVWDRAHDSQWAQIKRISWERSERSLF